MLGQYSAREELDDNEGVKYKATNTLTLVRCRRFDQLQIETVSATH